MLGGREIESVRFGDYGTDAPGVPWRLGAVSGLALVIAVVFDYLNM